MAKPGGPLSMIGITPDVISSVVTTSVSSGVTSSANKLFRGVANQSLARAGSALVGNVASNVVNVGINSLLGSQVSGASGFNLNSGANILASTVTPYVTASLAQGINQSIQNSLKGAGPLGSVLSQIGTGLVNQGINSLTNLITGAAKPGSGQGGGGSRYFPGAGDEPAADYGGGKAYTLGSNGPDVVIAIRPANAGPLAAAAAESANNPTVPTTQSTTQTADPAKVPSPAVNAAKAAVMLGSPRSQAYAGNR